MRILKNNPANVFKPVAMLLLAATLFTSCKKDKADVPSNSRVEGKWSGKDGFGPTPGYAFYFTLKSGGNIDVTNAAGAVKGSGNWTLVGTEFKANYQYVAPLFTKFMMKGTYNQATGKITGLWGFEDGLYDEGAWYANKLP